MITRCLEQNVLASFVQYEALDRGPVLFRKEQGHEISQYFGGNGRISAPVKEQTESLYCSSFGRKW
jgi:hypothetical protein